MYAKDKPDFILAMKALCAGYDVNYTDLRGDAYFGGLERMSLSQFSQCVDHCLGPDSIFKDKLPKAPQMWKVWDEIKRLVRQETAPKHEVHRPPEHSPLRHWVDGMFYIWLNQRRKVEGFTGDIRLEDRRRACIELAEYLEGMASEEMKPALEEAQYMFNRAMEKIPLMSLELKP